MRFLFLMICVFLAGMLPDVSAQDAMPPLKNFTVSGYLHLQYFYAGRDADGVNLKAPAGVNAQELDARGGVSRFSIRRGRIAFQWQDSWAKAVLVPNLTERGVSVMDAFMEVSDPWLGVATMRAGYFDRPFGYEVPASAATYESPENSRVVQSIFVEEDALGAMLTVRAPKESPWHVVTLEGGLFSGNGARAQIDSRMDFIGHLTVKKDFGSSLTVSAGVSAYLGGVPQRDSSVFEVRNGAFALRSKSGDNVGRYAPRRYLGFDIQASIKSSAGTGQLKAEYIRGVHPGGASGAYEFRFTALPAVEPVYMRRISGGYVMLTHTLGALPLTAVAKYDWYDPNVDIQGDAIAGAGEIAMRNVGVGMLWKMSKVLRLSAYCDVVRNETSPALGDELDVSGNVTKRGYARDREDNVLTLQLQYRF